MKIELKWLPNGCKTPAPSHYACTITFEKPDTGLYTDLYSATLHFLDATRIYAELELLVVKDLDIGDAVFYITEGGRVVAEAKRTV